MTKGLSLPRSVTNGKSGPVLLGHRLTLTVDRVHDQRLRFVAAQAGETSPTVAAERLLVWAIDYHVQQIAAACVVNVLTRVLSL